MKRKTKNKKSFLQADWNAKIYFAGILVIAFWAAYTCLFFSLSLIKNVYWEKCATETYSVQSDINNIAVKTDKNIYSGNEKISFSIINKSNKAIYVKPCEYIANYEKKVDGKWLKIENNKTQEKYDSLNFDKKEKEVICSITPPETAGIFKIALNVYSKCRKAGAEFCQESKKLYSNEFEVKNIIVGCGCNK